MTKVYCPFCKSTDIRVYEKTETSYTVDDDGNLTAGFADDGGDDIECLDCDSRLNEFFEPIDWDNYKLIPYPAKYAKALLNKLSEPLDVLEKTFTPEQV